MDPGLIGEITSAGSLAVSTINLIISRLDKRRGALEHPDSVSALTDLEQLLSSWVDDSIQTNNAVQDFIEGRGDWSGVQHARITQLSWSHVTSYVTENLIGIVSGDIVEHRTENDSSAHEARRKARRRKRYNLTQFLRIYAPEFADEFQAAAKKRYGLLREIQFGSPEFFESEANARELSKALTGSSRDLNKSLNELRRFMRDNIKS